MSDHLLFLSTDEDSLGSAAIRRLTLCDWSHVGFYRKSDGWNFSAMNDGKGVAWRGPNKDAKILLLDSPHVDEMLKIALTQEGKPYNRKEILGFALNRNWSKPDSFDCCQLVFWSALEVGWPLVNMNFIPLEHMTPRDVLLSPLVSEHK